MRGVLTNKKNKIWGGKEISFFLKKKYKESPWNGEKIDQNIFPTNLPSPPDTLAKKIPLVSMGGWV